MNNATPPAHPGVILLEKAMKPLGVSRNKLARDIDVPVGRISDIVSGKRGISPDTALRLAKYFGTSAEMWMRLQWEYDLYVARVTVWPRIDPRVRVFEPSEVGSNVAVGDGDRAVDPVLPDLPDPVLRGVDAPAPEQEHEAPTDPEPEEFDHRNGEAAAGPAEPDRDAPVEPPTRFDAFARSTDVAVAERPSTVVPTSPPAREPVAAMGAVAEKARQAAAVMIAGAPSEEIAEPHFDRCVAQAEVAPEITPETGNEPIREVEGTDATDPVALSPAEAFVEPAIETARQWPPDTATEDLDLPSDIPETTGYTDDAPDEEVTLSAATSTEEVASESTDLEPETSATVAPTALDAFAPADRPLSPAITVSVLAASEAEPSSPAAALTDEGEFSTPAIFAAVNGANHDHIDSDGAAADADGSVDIAEAPGALAVDTEHSADLVTTDVALGREGVALQPATAEAAQPEVIAAAPAIGAFVETPSVPASAPYVAVAENEEPLSEAAPLTLVDEVGPPLFDDVDDDEPLLLTEELPSLDIPDPDEARYRVRRGVD